MKKKWIIIVAVCTICLISYVFAGPIMSKVEEPKYKVILTSDNIEVRKYAPMVIAFVEVGGERKQAISNGFRLVADYIFGNNMGQKKVAMTAPVQQQGGKKIAMTAPVQQQAVNNTWEVSFVMPSEYSLNELPIPNNNQVKLIEIPAQDFIVIKFSGTNSDKNIRKHEELLMKYINEHHLKTIGTAKYAFYNPPWTLPFMRRNEIMIEADIN